MITICDVIKQNESELESNQINPILELYFAEPQSKLNLPFRRDIAIVVMLKTVKYKGN